MSMKTSSVGVNTKAPVQSTSVDKAPAPKKNLSKDTITKAEQTNTPAKEGTKSLSFGEKIKSCFQAFWKMICDLILCRICGKKESSKSNATNKPEEKNADDVKNSGTVKANKKDETKAGSVNKTANKAVVESFKKEAREIRDYFSACQEQAKAIAKVLKKDGDTRTWGEFRAELAKERNALSKVAKSDKGPLVSAFSAFMSEEILKKGITQHNVEKNAVATLKFLTSFQNTCRILMSKSEAFAFNSLLISKQKVAPQDLRQIFAGLNDNDKKYLVDQMAVAVGQKAGSYSSKDFDEMLRISGGGDTRALNKTSQALYNHFEGMIDKYLRSEIAELNN